MMRAMFMTALRALLAFSLCWSQAFASQGSYIMPTTGTVSGLTLVTDINAALDAIATCNSGATQPLNSLAAPSPGQFWCDNATAGFLKLKQYDGASWLEHGRLDTTNHIWIPTFGGGAGSITAASTTDLGTVAQTFVTVNGATTINGFGSTAQPGTIKILTFASSPAITYNATSMILPGGLTITAAIGDQAIAVALGGGNWTLFFQRASGQAVSNPAVPVGTVLQYAGLAAPASYDFAYGQTYSRASFAALLTALTSTQSVSRTNGSPTLTGFSDTTQFGNGMPIEGAGIPASTTILSCAPTTCTMSLNATSTGTANAQVFPSGNGNGSTTFTLPDMRGAIAPGRDNMGGTAKNVLQASTTITTTSGSPTATVASATGIAAGMVIVSTNVPAGTTVSSINGTTVTMSGNASASAGGIAARFSSVADAQALGGSGGLTTRTLTTQEIPSHTHAPTDPGHFHSFTNRVLTNQSMASGGFSTTDITTASVNTDTKTTGITIGNAGGGSAHSIVQPSVVQNYIIRVSP